MIGILLAAAAVGCLWCVLEFVAIWLERPRPVRDVDGRWRAVRGRR